MSWIESGIGNPSKSEVIGRCGEDEKTNDHAEPTKVERSKNTYKKTGHYGHVLRIFKYLQ